MKIKISSMLVYVSIMLISAHSYISGMKSAAPKPPAKNFESLFNQATAEFKQGNFDQALQTYQSALAVNPHCYQIHFNIGLIYIQKQQYEQAIDALQKVISYNPTYAKAHLHIGIASQRANKIPAAIEHLRKAVNLNPQYHEAIAQLARALNENSQFSESIEYFNRALAIQPNDGTILLDLANTLNMNNQTEQALETYYILLKMIPHNASILYNIAYTLKKLNRIDEAMPYYHKVLELEPSHAEAHFSLSLAYLASGDFERGWSEYEWRWKRGQNSPRNLGKPLWDGSSLQGKTILLHAEQGLGDSFQFIRYAKVLKEQGARVVAAVHPPLVQLFKLCPYIDHVVSLFEHLPIFDTHAPLMTLPYILKTRLETVPHEIPYLYADPIMIQEWKEKLSLNKNFKIGICWQGNSNYSTHFLRTAVAAKSISVTQFLPLLTMPGITVYNLQKTTGEEQLKNLPENINMISFDESFDSAHGRFMDTAAVMKNLDLMITVDTSIAHLAGGLGIPVWCLLPEPADWRWMLDRTDTPWYPNMRLFRQPKSGDWDSVIQTIILELKQLMNTKPNAEHAIEKLNTQIAALEKELQIKETHAAFDAHYTHLNHELFELYTQRNKLKKELKL